MTQENFEDSAKVRELIQLVEQHQKGELSLNKLPYDSKDLDPVMSEATLDYHYSKLAKGYVDRYNKKEGDPYFNESGAYLHNVFFPQLKAPSGANNPTGSVEVLIKKKFGSFADFKKRFAEEAMKIQGSGWIYLNRQGEIKTIKNLAVRTDIAMIIDWWEHAWALDYQSDKAKYLENMWKIINWDVVNQRL